MIILNHLILSFFVIFCLEARLISFGTSNCIDQVFSIPIPEYPNSFNPSIIEVGEEYILTFRYQPSPDLMPWISFIGLLRLDKSFNRKADPFLLDLRGKDNPIPSQTEDARIFQYKDDLYVIYNDNRKVINPRQKIERRDIYMAKLTVQENQILVQKPLKLIHPKKYGHQLWEKNWSPFVYKNELYISYSFNPHEVLKVDLSTGISSPVYSSKRDILYDKGPIRGGTPSLLLDGYYFGFFHSNLLIASESSNGKEMWHYFMGAYLFEPEPPFRVKYISQKPLIHKEFYTKDNYGKRVIYPGGFIVAGDKILVAYGKNDREVFIAVIDKEKLFKGLLK